MLPLTCVVAIEDVFVRRWARYAIAAAGLHAREVGDRAALFDAISDEPAALVVARRFDGAPSASLLASLRAAGSGVRVVVIDAGVGRVLDSRVLAAALDDGGERQYQRASR